MKTRDDIFADYLIERHPGKGCLIPKKGVGMPTCHEKDYCECDVLEAMKHAHTSRDAEIPALRAQLESAKERIKELERGIDPICPECFRVKEFNATIEQQRKALREIKSRAGGCYANMGAETLIENMALIVQDANEAQGKDRV